MNLSVLIHTNMQTCLRGESKFFVGGAWVGGVIYICKSEHSSTTGMYTICLVYLCLRKKVFSQSIQLSELNVVGRSFHDEKKFVKHYQCG